MTRRNTRNALVAILMGATAMPAGAQDPFRTLIPLLPHLVVPRQGQPPADRRVRRPAVNEPAMSLSTRRQVQLALRELGYYRGAIDGAFGRGTRAAIANWQASRGVRATGLLTSQNIRTLTAMAPAAGGYDTALNRPDGRVDDPFAPEQGPDAGGGDPFAAPAPLDGPAGGPFDSPSGGDDFGAMPGGTIEGTFDDPTGGALPDGGSRVTVLESGILPDDGMSGTFGGDDGLSGSFATGPLARREVLELQARLSAMGYDTGGVDGVWGRRSEQALSRYQADNGLEPDGRPTRRAARDLGIGGAVAERPAQRPVVPAGPTIASSGTPVDEAAAEAVRSLALRAIRQEPQLLSGTGAVSRFLQADDRFGRREAFGQLSRANELDAPRIVEAAAGQIRAEAAAVSDAPVRLTLLFSGTLEAYDPRDGAFPLRIYSAAIDPVRGEISLAMPHVGGTGIAAFEGFPDISRIAVTEAEADRLLAAMSGDRSRSVTGVVTITVDGWRTILAGERPQLELDARLEDVTLNASDRGKPGRVLYRWPREGTVEPAVPGGTDTLALARSLGVPMIGDRLNVTAVNGIGWSRLIDLIALGADPTLARSDERVLALAARNDPRVLRQTRNIEQDIGYGAYSQRQFRDEFELKAYIDDARLTLIPQLTASKPELPIRIIEVREVSVETYDFDAGHFPLRYNERPALRLSERAIVPVTATLPLTSLPKSLPMARDEAAALNQSLRAGSRKLYLATAATIETAAIARSPNSPNSERLDLKLAVDAIGIFAESGLTREILRYDVEPLLLQANQRSISNDAALVTSIRPASRIDLLRTVVELGGDADLAADLVRASPEYQQANEFEQPEILAARTRQFMEMVPLADGWLTGTVDLDRYEDGAFPVRFTSLRGDNGGPLNLPSNDLKLQIANNADIARLPVDAALARTAIEANPDRRFEAGVRVRPAKATVTRNGNRTEMELWLDAVELVVWHEQRGGDGTAEPMVLGWIRPGADNETEAEASEPAADAGPLVDPDAILPFGQETADLYRLKLAPEGVSDVDWQRMLYDRWALEAMSAEPPAGRFFPAGSPAPNLVERERLMDRFRGWTTERVEALSGTVAVTFRPDGSGSTCMTGATGLSVAGYPGRYIDPADGTTATPATLQDLDGVAGKLSEPAIVAPLVLAFDRKDQSGGECLTPAGFDARRALTDIGLDYYRLPATVVVVDEIALLPGDSAGFAASAKVLTGAVTAVDTVPDQYGNPEFVVRIDAETTDYVAVDPATMATGDQIDRLDHAAIREASASADADLPDIVGLSLGMDMAAAEEAIRAHMPVGRVIEAQRLAIGDPKAKRQYGSGKAFIREDGREAIVVYDEPPDAAGEVVAVARTVYLPGGSVAPDAAVGLLRDKYGPETNLTADAASGRFHALWEFGSRMATAETQMTCYIGDGTSWAGNDGARWIESGVIGDPWLTVPEAGGRVLPYTERPMYLRKPPATPAPAPEGMINSPTRAATCRPVVISTYNLHDGAEVLATVLMDPGRYAELYRAALAEPDGPPPGSAETTPPAVDLKL